MRSTLRRAAVALGAATVAGSALVLIGAAMAEMVYRSAYSAAGIALVGVWLSQGLTYLTPPRRK